MFYPEQMCVKDATVSNKRFSALTNHGSAPVTCVLPRLIWSSLAAPSAGEDRSSLVVVLATETDEGS